MISSSMVSAVSVFLVILPWIVIVSLLIGLPSRCTTLAAMVQFSCFWSDGRVVGAAVSVSGAKVVDRESLVTVVSGWDISQIHRPKKHSGV